MERVLIKDIKDYIGQDVLIKGFVHVLRDQNKIAFIIMRDITGQVQCVVLKECVDFIKIKEISEESVLEIIGFVKEEKQAPGGFEIETKTINILSLANPELPIPINSKKGGEETNSSTRLDYRWLDLRKPEKANIFKTWTALEKGFRDYLYSANYLQVYTPSFMNSASETGAEVFEVKYFEKKAYLAQSPQFYKQMAIASGLDRVFITGPVFRAELSFTTRHLTEFSGWDFEIGFVNSHYDIMDEEEKMIKAGFTELKNILPELEIPAIPFPRITLKEAKDKLKAGGLDADDDTDLNPEEERTLCEIIKKETDSDFVFVCDYPISKRPFYHMRHENNPELTKSADLLYRGIEITTLAQREHRFPKLMEQAKEKRMDLETLTDYLNFFKYGCPPHGGGGIGLNRLVMKLLDYDNVREVTFLPRDVNRLNP
jgi:aspartyl-tRNA synthetase